MTPPLFLFVSHVSEDRAASEAIVGELEHRGVKCWIAPRDVRPGKAFDNEIAYAIENCRAMLLIFSDHCNASEYIRREVTVAGDAGKVIIPFRIEDARPKSGLRVRLSDLHWIDGFVSRERAIDELVATFLHPEDAMVETPAVDRAPSVVGEERLRKETEGKRRAGDQTRQRKAEVKQRPAEQTSSPRSRLAQLSMILIGVLACGFIGAYYLGFGANQTSSPMALVPQLPAPEDAPTLLATRRTCANCPRQAESHVPMAIVQVISSARTTEVQIQAQAARTEVCWTLKGTNSPYLLASGRRYHYLGGDNVTDCPQRQEYAVGEVMVLRFEPLDAQVKTFALVEGEGGENQILDSGGNGMTFWNFLSVALN
jgi:hypothetical protein